jgi:hypothetical protein
MVLWLVLTISAIGLSPDSGHNDMWKMAFLFLLLTLCSAGYGVEAIAGGFGLVC